MSRLWDKTRGWTAACTLLVVASGIAFPASLEIGQRWQYRHEGPRPGSVEPNAIDGDRVRWVLSADGDQGGAGYIVEERFTNDAKIIGRLYVNQDGFLEAVEIVTEKGEVVRLRYDPPVPYQPTEMTVGQTRTMATTVRLASGDFALPVETVTERLADETVATAAGEFADCSHYRSTTISTVDIRIAKIPVTEEREQWYHPAANGMVREVYRRGPVKFLGWSRPGYTATSTLAAHDRQTPPPAKLAQDPNSPAALERSQAGTETSDASGQPSPPLLLSAVVVAVVCGGLVAGWRVQRRRRVRL